MRHGHYFLSAIVATNLLLMSGCSLAPKLEMPSAELPSDYAPKSDQNSSLQEINIAWWEGFKDPRLDSLIKEALERNSNLMLAASNVALSRASLSAANAELYPSLTLQGGANSIQGSANSYPATGSQAKYDNFSLSAVLSYEIDLWGRLRDSKKAAASLLLAQEATQEVIRLSVASGVAELYFNLLALSEQERIAREVMDSYEESYGYRQKQHQYGVISETLLHQAKSEWEAAKISFYQVEQQRIQATVSLGILLGREPKELFREEILTLDSFPVIPAVPVGMPSELLAHRADIKAAEEQLKAANLSIGVARANHFPRLSLSGAFGYQSAELDTLFQSNSQTSNVGATLGVSVFEFGKVQAGVRGAEAKKAAAEIQYQATIRQAFGEVRNALVNRERAMKSLEAFENQAMATERSYEIAEKFFAHGRSNHLELLSAKRQQLLSQASLSHAKLAAASSVVTLYKALGGGWREP